MPSYVFSGSGAPGNRSPQGRRYDPEKARERYVRRLERAGKPHRTWRNNPRRSHDEIVKEQAEKIVRMQERERERQVRRKVIQHRNAARAAEIAKSPTARAAIYRFDAILAESKGHATPEQTAMLARERAVVAADEAARKAVSQLGSTLESRAAFELKVAEAKRRAAGVVVTQQMLNEEAMQRALRRNGAGN